MKAVRKHNFQHDVKTVKRGARRAGTTLKTASALGVLPAPVAVGANAVGDTLLLGAQAAKRVERSKLLKSKRR